MVLLARVVVDLEDAGILRLWLRGDEVKGPGVDAVAKNSVGGSRHFGVIAEDCSVGARAVGANCRTVKIVAWQRSRRVQRRDLCG